MRASSQTLLSVGMLAFPLVLWGCGGGRSGDPPTIETHPVDQTVTAGHTATLSVTASGDGTLSYQWQRSDDGGSTWADVSGATSSSYTTPPLTALESGAQFVCVVTGDSGETTSLAATVVVDPHLIERANVTSAGEEATNGSCFGAAITPDGRYVGFCSTTTDLVTGDTNAADDVFIHDRQTGLTERVSVDSSGVEGNGSSESNVAISADGRFVAFFSGATNLVTGDTNAAWDVFVRDRQGGTTERVSVDGSGTEGNGNSEYPSISWDGRFVAFRSSAANLVPGDTNGNGDVFVHDSQTGLIERASVDSAGAETGGCALSCYASISSDGRYVAFGSPAADLVPGDTNVVPDIFVRDRLSGTTERVSVSTSGAEADDESRYPVVSADGRYVTFCSRSSNLAPGDTGSFYYDVIVRDRQMGTTEMASIDSSGVQADRHSWRPSISSDGRFVAFESNAGNLVPGDTGGHSDIFVHDRLTGVTTRVSIGSSGAEGDGDSIRPVISADGRHVAFQSLASNLVPGDTNGLDDIFVARNPLAP